MKSLLCYFILILPLIAFGDKEVIQQVTPKGTFYGENFGGARLFPYIAYAEAPVGKYRWRKVPLTKTARQAKSPVQCPQFGDDTFKGGNFPMQEDCLYMNVWAPQTGEKHPVILFIHGGGLISGNGVQKFYDGSIFTDKGVVFVAFNYRLAELGYGPTLEKDPSSLGLWDQKNAIDWVIENIAHFGGDPNNIYLMGHSKGAEAVGALMETGLASEHVKGGIAMSYATHFNHQSNQSFDKIQYTFLPGEKDAPWQKVIHLDTEKKIGVYVPYIPSLRKSGEGKHRFQLITTVMYDERFWGNVHDMYCTQAFFHKYFFDYIDSYFFVVHPGEYDHGEEVYALFSQSTFGKAFRDYIVKFVNEGRPPSLTFGVKPKPFRNSLQTVHLYPWFSLTGKFRDEWKDVNCVKAEGYPGSQIGFFWFKLESILNFFGYGKADRIFVPNKPLNKDPKWTPKN